MTISNDPNLRAGATIGAVVRECRLDLNSAGFGKTRLHWAVDAVDRSDFQRPDREVAQGYRGVDAFA